MDAGLKTKEKLLFNYPKMSNLILLTFSSLSFDEIQGYILFLYSLKICLRHRTLLQKG